jgi:hypothetical protein
MRRTVLAAVVAAAALPAAAHADGLPLVDFGTRPAAVTSPDGATQYVALPAGRHTAVARLRRGSLRNRRLLPGRLAIPGVAYDGTAGGLSADGGRLALIEPRKDFPRARTRLTVLGPRLAWKRAIELKGDFSFDAISPDASALFLVEYPDRRDPSVYRVRVYDVKTERLLPKPLLDSKVAPIVMRGLPVTRATTGAVAYTLYDGFGKPFVHALDTAQRSALCIPLPRAAQTDDPYALKLRNAGTDLHVNQYGATLAVIDTESNRVVPPGPWWVRAAATGWLDSARAPTV